MNTNVNAIRNFLNTLNGRFFTVSFIKKDGNIRRLNGRLNVKKYLVGGHRLNQNDNHLIVYDVQNKGYRTVNLETVLTVHADHQDITFYNGAKVSLS